MGDSDEGRETDRPKRRRPVKRKLDLSPHHPLRSFAPSFSLFIVLYVCGWPILISSLNVKAVKP